MLRGSFVQFDASARGERLVGKERRYARAIATLHQMSS